MPCIYSHTNMYARARACACMISILTAWKYSSHFLLCCFALIEFVVRRNNAVESLQNAALQQIMKVKSGCNPKGEPPKHGTSQSRINVYKFCRTTRETTSRH